MDEPSVSRDGMAEFRPTVWPGFTVPVPPTRLWRVEVVESMFLRYLDLVSSSSVPEELYLRQLFELDAEDPEALAAFCESFGPLLPMGDPLAALPESEAYRGPFPGLVAGAAALADERGWHPEYVVAAELATLHVRALRAMARQWAGCFDCEDPREAWPAEGLTRPVSAFDAWRRFDDHLNSGLRPFSVHVVSDPDTRRSGGQPHGTVFPSTYSLMCLQLANHIAEEATYRRCSNCGTLFVRQLGRAAHGQYRTEGVIYCSRLCARAKAERDRRSRRRKETG